MSRRVSLRLSSEFRGMSMLLDTNVVSDAILRAWESKLWIPGRGHERP